MPSFSNTTVANMEFEMTNSENLTHKASKILQIYVTTNKRNCETSPSTDRCEIGNKLELTMYRNTS